MPRLPRIHLEGAIYYVTSRASQGRQIFKDKGDHQMYLELLTRYKSQHRFKLYAYSLLPDRLELVIETGDDATISEIMHDLNSLYTKYFNGRYDLRGSLFESRFRSVLVEKAAHLAELTRHVHRAALGEGLGVEHPYSSFLFYIGRPASGISVPDMAAEAAEVKAFLQHKDDPAFYEKYCLSGDPDQIEALEKSLRRGAVVGSEEFRAMVRERLERREAETKAAGETASKRPSLRVFALLGGVVLAAAGSAVYLYVSRAVLETKYTALLERKEAEFAERTRFENVSPLAPLELDGTLWEIELLPAGGGPADIVRDRIRFAGGRIRSEHFEVMGFQGTNYSKSAQPGGMNTWETIQWSASGASLAWRGDWKGDAMKGVVSLHPEGQPPRDFSFFSVSWSREAAPGGAQ